MNIKNSNKWVKKASKMPIDKLTLYGFPTKFAKIRKIINTSACEEQARVESVLVRC